MDIRYLVEEALRELETAGKHVWSSDQTSLLARSASVARSAHVIAASPFIQRIRRRVRG